MQEIKKKLAHISTDYKPIPFWSWNNDLEPDELVRQIRWMKDMEIGGFFMHARGGLRTPYMSDEWMECIATCCDEAEKLGMDAWGYDENGWPSGFAGGKLLEDINNRDMYIHSSKGAFDENADISYLINEENLIRTTENAEEGDYLNLYLGRSASTVDVLNPEVVKQFIALTHEQYKEYFGDKFSEKFKGFFTDEPQFYRGGGTPYSPMLEKYFYEHYEKDIFDELGLLFVKKEGWRSFRYRYWLAMQTLFLDSFAKPVYQWCKENNVQFTGHYIAEDLLGPQLACCGGIMPFYEYMDIPGIDWLSKDTNLELGPRQVGSVARQMGKRHVLTETFAGCGWNCSPEEFRRIAGFQYVNGATLMCHHLLPYAEHGQRKRDYPAHFSPINPWIKENFKEFNEYFTKLGYLLATGEEPVKVAMLHPIRSAYFEFQQDEEANAYNIRDLEESLMRSMRTLSSRGISFHFLDETILEKHGFVKERQIGCGKCRYDYLVLPDMLTMGTATEALLREYVKQGGKILMFGNAPQYLEGEPHAYEYLQSNCKLEDIMETQPFQVSDTENELYYAYRLVEGKPFLFVQNASGTKEFKQTFQFKDGSQSFVSYNPVTMEEKQVPLTVTIHENEALLLFPEEAIGAKTEGLEEVSLRFCDAEVEFDDNYLTIDKVRFSTNGEDYSKPIYVNTLFRQLLEQRYHGKLWIKYCFEIKSMPEALQLIAERDNTVEGKVNGHKITFMKGWEEDQSFAQADILPFVHIGDNSYEIVMDWHQSEDTYYALFGENVTESLKNCICYNSEIEAVYLKGKFGVYSYTEYLKFSDEAVCGNDFYIGDVPEKITEPTTEGLPFFRGKFKLKQKVFLNKTNIMFHIMGQFLVSKIWVNGNYVGKLLFDRRIDVSPYVRDGENVVEVEFTIGNNNLFGPLHQQRYDWMLCPWYFDVEDMPKDEKGETGYKLNLFNI